MIKSTWHLDTGGAPVWFTTLILICLTFALMLPLVAARASDLSEHCGPGAFSPPAPQAECDTIHQVPEAPTWALLLIGGLVFAGGWVARGFDEGAAESCRLSPLR